MDDSTLTTTTATAHTTADPDPFSAALEKRWCRVPLSSCLTFDLILPMKVVRVMLLLVSVGDNGLSGVVTSDANGLCVGGSKLCSLVVSFHARFAIRRPRLEYFGELSK